MISIETPKKTKQAVRAQPLAFVRADLTAAGERRLWGTLGKHCDFDNVNALVLGNSGAAVKLLTLSRFNCAVRTILVSEADASVEPVGLPSIELP